VSLEEEDNHNDPTARRADSISSSESEISAAEGKSITDALQKWKESLIANDPQREAAFYAPLVERYFSVSNVSIDWMLKYLRQQLVHGTSFIDFKMAQVTSEVDSDGTTKVHFIKTFTVQSAHGTRTSTCQSVLHLKKLDGAWKITYEHDTKL